MVTCWRSARRSDPDSGDGEGGEPEPCVLMLTHLSPHHGALLGGAAAAWGRGARLWVAWWFCSPLRFLLMNNRWDAHSLGSCAPAPTFIWVERIWVVFFPGPSRTPSCAGGIGSAVHAGPSSSIIFSLSAAADSLRATTTGYRGCGRSSSRPRAFRTTRTTAGGPTASSSPG